jgi:hypothetical protein
MKTKEQIIDEMQDLYEFGSLILYVEELEHNHKPIQPEKIDEEDLPCTMDEYKAFIFEYPTIQASYNKWYTTVLPLIKIIAPERLNDFIGYYKNDKRKKEEITQLNYTISDYLINFRRDIILMTLNGFDRFDEFSVFYIKLKNQLEILHACIINIDSVLFNVESVLQYDLYQSEIDAARDLLSKNLIRAAGALSGVILESQLKKTCLRHGIVLKKANPTISDCNEGLKANDVIDQITWRLISRLGDIRNLCVHAGREEPTRDQVSDLINGTIKIMAEIF